jgi:tetratricopeptide (TPR) repeat protein
MNQEHIKKINQARELYKNYEYDKALQCVNDVLNEDKNNLHACNLKAILLIDSWTGEESTINHIFEAKSHLEKVVKEIPKNNVYNYYNLGNAYYALSMFYFKKK